MQTPMHHLAVFVSYAIQVYIILIFVWVMGSWFPQWKGQQWYRIVDEIIRPYMNLFKALPLRMGQIDFTPIAAIFILYMIQGLLGQVIRGGM